MKKQILAFFFCFIRELTLYSPLTFSLILRANSKPILKCEIHGFYPPCIGVLFRTGLCRPPLPCVHPLMTHRWRIHGGRMNEGPGDPFPYLPWRVGPSPLPHSPCELKTYTPPLLCHSFRARTQNLYWYFINTYIINICFILTYV